MTDIPTSGSHGPATDIRSDPVLDPTYNVLQLVAAAIQRQDDLRSAESRHVREMVEIRADHANKLREAETERINAIRAVDVQAVQQAATVAETRASALAATVTQSAEAMRTQVAAAASAAATSLAAALEPIQKDIQDLRKAQYEQQGQKTQVTEGRAKGASTGLWVGIAVAALLGFMSFVAAAAALIVQLTS